MQQEDQLVLTDRDKRWLQQLADGVEPKNLSDSTPQAARNRLMRIRRILRANTTTEAVAKAFRLGLVN